MPPHTFNIVDPEVKKLQNKGINVNSWIVGERKRTRKEDMR